MTIFEKLAKEMPKTFAIDSTYFWANGRPMFKQHLEKPTVDLIILIADTIGVKIWAEPYDFNQVWAGRWYKSLSSAGTVAHRFDTQHKAFLAALEAAVDEMKGQPE